MYCYFNSGFSMYAVSADHVAGEGEVMFPDIPTEETLEAAFPGRAEQVIAMARSTAIAMVDDLAGRERAKYITVAPGQEMTYQEKVRQAQAFGDDAAPDEGKYPLIYGEVGITAADAAGVAVVVLQSFALWQQIGAAIEKVRLAAKRDINAAGSQAAIDAVLAGLVWPDSVA